MRFARLLLAIACLAGFGASTRSMSPRVAHLRSPKDAGMQPLVIIVPPPLFSQIQWHYSGSDLSNTTFYVWTRTNASAGPWQLEGVTNGMSLPLTNLSPAQQFFAVSWSNRVTGKVEGQPK